MRSRSILFLIIVLACIREASAECFWDDISLLPMNNSALHKAQSNLLYFEYIQSNIPSGEDGILFSCISEDHVLIWYGSHIDSPSIIKIFDLHGSFLFGYRLQFDLGNGFVNMNMHQGELLVFLSSTNCVYRFCEGDVFFFYADPHYENVMTKVSKSAPGIELHYSHNGTVTIVDSNGNTTLIADTTAQYEEPMWIYCFFAMIGVLLLLLILHEWFTLWKQ